MIERIKAALITDAGTKAAEAVARRLEKDGFLVIRNFPSGFPINLEGLDVQHCCAYETHRLSAVQEMLAWLGDMNVQLRVLVHTDNVIFPKKVEDISEGDFQYYVDRNAKSAFMTAKVMGEVIAKNGGGSIVFLSSLHDEKPTGVAFAYSAGRGAIKMLCKELTLFYGRKRVRCNLVEMDTTLETAELLDSLLVPFNYDIKSKIALRRVTEPEDFAGTVSYLVSDDAAQVNGAEIRVDGGHLYHYGDREV